ncbi:MAG TPA: ATP-binding cassette domain-containing protein, partial [Nitrococcus sp.]|nr:ATP-binding cassette domain-containing protein [Nitrococcus sp.]
LAGLERPCAGHVWLDGVDLTALDEDERAQVRAGRVGFVFQSFHLLPGLTALENVMLPRELAGESQARAQARAALEAVGLADRLHFYPAQLSGGEQQRVALARAFVTSPALLFADEPTGNLDRHTAERVSDLLFSLNERYGTTLILATHDAVLAGRCHAVLRLHEGRLEGPP